MKTLGQVVYEAFAAHLHANNYQGSEIPLYDDTAESVKLAWQVAADAAVDEFQNRADLALRNGIVVIQMLRNICKGEV